MSDSVQRVWAERAVRAVSRAFPWDEFSNWTNCERLLPQAHVCAELIKRQSLEFQEAADLLAKAAGYLMEQGRCDAAEPLYERSLAILEKALGRKHLTLATCLENYAILLQSMDQTEKAAELSARAASIRAQSSYAVSGSS